MPPSSKQSSRFHSVPLRTKRQLYGSARITHTQAHANTHAWEPEEERPYPLAAPLASMTRRYVTRQGQEVLEQGKQRLIIHQGKPPTSLHPLLLMGMGMLTMIALVCGGISLLSWWSSSQLQSQYGYPRTWQTDVVVGQGGDSAAHPTHFLFENLHGQILIIELPAGSARHALIYTGPTLYGPDAANLPVTATFRDLTGNRKLDMIVQIGSNQSMVYLNTGTKFVSEQS